MPDDHRRKRVRFAAALGLFVLWIGALALLIRLEGVRPPEPARGERPPAPVGSARGVVPG
jgi:hypothetical protein